MPQTLNEHDTIIWLKEIKNARKLTPQKIFEILELAGYHVSLNTIKKVFEDGSENRHFNYHGTIEPIYLVLRGIYGQRSSDAEVDALQIELHVCREQIEKLKQEKEMDKADYRRRLDFLMDQIEKKDRRIDKLMGRVDGVLKTNKDVLANNREMMGQIQKLIEKL